MRTLKNNAMMLGYIFRYVPMMAAGMLICTALGSVSDVMFNTILIKYVIDSVAYGRAFSSVLLFILLLAAYGLASGAFTSWFNDKYFYKAKEILHQKMQTGLFEHAIKLDLACYDNPEFYNNFIWATSEADTRAVTVLQTVSDFLREGIVFVSLTILALLWDPFVLVFIASSFAVSFYFGLGKNKKRYAYQMELKPKERKRDYIGRTFYLADYAKEIRLSGIHSLLLEKLHENTDSMIQTVKKHGAGIWFSDTLGNVLGNAAMMDILCVLYLSYRVLVVHAISPGTFVALVTSIWNIRWALQTIIGIFPRFSENSLYTENFRAFLACRPKLADDPSLEPAPCGPMELTLKNVSFSYGGNTQPTLKNVSMTIKPHETVAIVGHNGAGKSTLIKLLMRLYDATEGEILLGGKNIREYSLKSYYRNFGVVFQDFQIFAATIAENVVMDEAKQSDDARIEEALESAGFGEKLKTLPKGIRTPLTKEFSGEGVNLSGGERQKVAIARTFARNCSFVILDEPSSALDPISEYNLNHAMLKAAGDKSVVLISHRLSTTRMADRIYVLDKGRIVEQGSHDELMRLNGKYAGMFRMQAEKYLENVSF